MINNKLFFDQLRNAPFGKVLTQLNVDGINAILSMWSSNYRSMDTRYLAYILATVFEETDGTMDWRKEEKYNGNAKDYFSKKYDGRSDLGNTQPGDGYRFRGRSWPQLTGRRNYTLFTKLTGVDLVGNPDAIKDRNVASTVLFRGMIEGLFTGRKLADFFKLPTYTREYMYKEAYEARTVVNGHAAADLIANYFLVIYAAIIKSQMNDPADVPAPALAAVTQDASADTADGTATVLPVIPVADKEETKDVVDHGKSLVQSFVVAGGTLSTLAGSIGTLAGSLTSFTTIANWYPIIAIGMFLLLILGFILLIMGRLNIKYKAGY